MPYQKFHRNWASLPIFKNMRMRALSRFYALSPRLRKAVFDRVQYC